MDSENKNPFEDDTLLCNIPVTLNAKTHLDELRANGEGSDIHGSATYSEAILAQLDFIQQLIKKNDELSRQVIKLCSENAQLRESMSGLPRPEGEHKLKP